MKIIGQFNNTYILIEKDKELYIIDQHAAHEKVLFEKFKCEIEKGYVISQILLSPVVIELSEDEFNIYEENKDIFKLIEDMLILNNPYTCPHGRPTMIKFTLKDLEKFKRIQ